MSNAGGGAGAGAGAENFPVVPRPLTAMSRPLALRQRMMVLLSSYVGRPLVTSAAYLAGAAGGMGTHLAGHADSVYDQFHAWLSKGSAEKSALSLLCDIALSNPDYMRQLKFFQPNLQALQDAGIKMETLDKDSLSFQHEMDALQKLVVILVQYKKYYESASVQAFSGQRGITSDALEKGAAQVLIHLMIWIQASKLHAKFKGETLNATLGMSHTRSDKKSWNPFASSNGNLYTSPLVRGQSTVTVEGITRPELNDNDGNVFYTICETLNYAKNVQCKNVLGYFLDVLGKTFDELTPLDCFYPQGEWNLQVAVPAGDNYKLAQKTKDTLLRLKDSIVNLRRLPALPALPDFVPGANAGAAGVGLGAAGAAGAAGVGLGAAAGGGAGAGAGAGAANSQDTIPAENSQGGGRRLRNRKSRRARRARKHSRRR